MHYKVTGVLGVHFSSSFNFEFGLFVEYRYSFLILNA